MGKGGAAAESSKHPSKHVGGSGWLNKQREERGTNYELRNRRRRRKLEGAEGGEHLEVRNPGGHQLIQSSPAHSAVSGTEILLYLYVYVTTCYLKLSKNV